MTEQQKATTAPAVYGTALLVLGWIVSNWEGIRPVLDHGLLLLGAVVLHPLVQAVVVGTLVGAGIAWRLPHDFPSRFQERDTVVRLRWYCSALTWVITFALYPAPLGIACGALAGVAGQYVLVCALRSFYRVFPQAKPSSLQPNP